MSEETLIPQDTYPCHDCAAGVMHLQYVTYFTWLADELITVPNFPAWVCDVCGKRTYDQRAIKWLSAMLNPDAGHPAAKRRRPVHPAPRRRTSRPSTTE